MRIAAIVVEFNTGRSPAMGRACLIMEAYNALGRSALAPQVSLLIAALCIVQCYLNYRRTALKDPEIAKSSSAT